MDNVRTKKRQWRPRRPDDQQPRGRNQIHLPRYRLDNTMSSKVQQYSENTQTKADITQLAAFLKKRSFSDSTNTCTSVNTSDVIKTPSHTCDDKPVYKQSRNSFCTSIKEHTSVQDSVHCDIKHMTVLGPETKPPCLKAEIRPVAVFVLEDDFDYSLDLMGDYTLKESDHHLKESDHSKEPTPFWFEAGQTSCGTYVPVKLAYDEIPSSRRGYTYINNKRNRGMKRRISYDDDEEVPIPCKRSRTC